MAAIALLAVDILTPCEGSGPSIQSTSTSTTKIVFSSELTKFFPGGDYVKHLPKDQQVIGIKIILLLARRHAAKSSTPSPATNDESIMPIATDASLLRHTESMMPTTEKKSRPEEPFLPTSNKKSRGLDNDAE